VADPSKPKLFISYAHSDGAELAQRLLTDLKDAGHEVWLDTERLTGGSSWTNEIEEAIDACDVIIALLSHASSDSRICRAEQLRGLRKEKRLVGCKVQHAAEPPLHLEPYNWISFDDGRGYNAAFQALTTAIAGTETAAIPKKYRQRRVTVDPLPQGYVPRTKELGKLRDLVLEDLPEKHTVAITGVRAEGGIGKTVLAQALCDDPAVQDAYPDGVVWVTIGREGEQLVEKLRNAGRALGDKDGEYLDLTGAGSQLRTILRDKAALLVLDDVWEAKHAQPFLAQNTPRCRYLFTTRRQQVSIDLLAEEIPLNVLEPGEAKQLLAKHAGVPEDKLPPEAETIVEICGGLAIALSHVGDEVRKRIRNQWPDPWASVVADLREADFEQYGIAATFDVSINSLDEAYRQRYLDMAVFPDDTPIPMATLATFWQVGQPTAAYKTVDAWIDASLARKDQDGRVYLHDLQMDYVKARARNRETELHQSLLLAYRERWGAWTALENDGYILDRLAWHLKQARRDDDLRQLLLNPDWLRLRLNQSMVNALESDYDQLPDDQDLQSIRRAIQVCSHILAAQPEQMKGQLYGRLAPIDSGPVQQFWRRLAETETAPWIRPCRASLEPEGGAELRVLTGHSDPVNAVALTPDGSCAVSASHDGTLRVWDLSSGDCLHTLVGHSDSVAAVALTPDGSRAVSASRDHTLRVWDLSSGECLHTLPGHTDYVAAVALTPDGTHVVSASGDHMLRVWDLSSGECLHTLEGHSSSVDDVVLTPDGTRAVSAASDNTCVWDLSSGDCLHILAGNPSYVQAVALTPGGRRAVSASSDATLRVWDLSSGDCLHTLAGHSGEVLAVALTPDGRRAVSASIDQTLRVWNLTSSDSLHTLVGHSGQVRAPSVPT
jgi:WD40 repeat protein